MFCLLGEKNKDDSLLRVGANSSDQHGTSTFHHLEEEEEEEEEEEDGEEEKREKKKGGMGEVGKDGWEEEWGWMKYTCTGHTHNGIKDVHNIILYM